MAAQESSLSDLRKQVSAFPRLPGVYLMHDDNDKVIYVGKAKDLRARVRSYFAGGDDRHQIQYLLRRVRRIEKIVTGNEQQAFILERDLIARHKPRYNIRLKDDKAYLSIRIDENQAWPKLELVRRVEHDGARYFGPYSFSHEIRELLDIINRVIPLRTCTNTVFYNRQRPCLEHQIKRCLGPCCLPVAKQDYETLVKQAIAVLGGRTDGLVQELSAKMEAAAAELMFEDAALLRDRIEILQNFKQGQRYISSRGEDRDVFALHREEKLATLSVLMVRNGRLADNRNFSFSDVEVPDAEIIEEALTQYYEGGREIPPEVVLPCELEDGEFVQAWFKEQKGAQVEICVPKKGVKFRLLGLAELNAHQHFMATFDAERRAMELAKGVARLLKLKQVPRRIECVDISNLQGSDIVGAIVVFYDAEPDKKAYKRYHITRQGKPDDFAAVYEVVGRRLRRGAAEDDLPDLLIIDGGPGQLGAALQARDELKVNIEIAALAKYRPDGFGEAKTAGAKPERVFLEGAAEAIALECSSEITHFLARIRDEAHRFVIGFHRSTRAKRVVRSVLDQIPGVGPDRKRRLFKEFGSIEGMKKAGVDDLAKAGRMPAPLARKILTKLRGE